VKRCPRCGEENADRARFCSNCATPLGEPGAPAGEVRKVVTIVFADVTGSTALGERLDPEALRRVMGRYFDEMSAVIERHGGTVEKFIGDAVMAVFGIPRLHEDDAVRAVRAAAGMREALAELNLQLEREHGVGIEARIGVNSGEVVAGDPSAGQRLVTGDPVNVAARLEQAASPGDVFLGATTYQLVKDAVEVEPVGALDLKGKGEPVPAYRLVAVLVDVAGHVRHLDSPMVGRGKELEMLERALERAVTERTSHLFTLLGSAGVGKSRLVGEFLDGPLGTATVLRGRCLSYGEGITFFPLAEVIHQAADILEGEPPAAARSKLEALLAGSTESERVASLVAGLFGWGPPGCDGGRLLGRPEGPRTPRPRTAGRGGLRRHPLGGADDAGPDRTPRRLDTRRGRPPRLPRQAGAARGPPRMGWRQDERHLDPPRTAARRRGFVAGRQPPRAGRHPPRRRDRILEAAEGNPLFVEEMLAMLIDDGLLRFEEGSWRSVEDLANVTVPPTIHLLLAARLDRLDAEERAVIERGAVEGKVFHTGAVTTLSPASARPNVRSRLLALARKELIRPDRAEFAGEDAFRFRHLLIRDAAHQAMPKEQRADLHERFAEWLANAAAERITEYEEILGYHLEQAYRYRTELGTADERTWGLARRAGAHLYRCGVRADERDDFKAARAFLDRSLELLDGTELVRAMVLLAEILDEDLSFQEALDAATRAVGLANETGDRRLALRAELVRSSAIGQVDPTYTLGQARADVEAALEALETVGEEEDRDRALILLARFSFFEGRTVESAAIATRLMERSSLTRRQRQEIAAEINTAAYFGTLPLDEAFVAMERADEIVGGSLSGEAMNLRTKAGLLGMAGRFDEAWASAERSAQRYAELGIPMRHISGIQMIAETERLAGRFDEAERLFRESHEAFDEAGETGFNSTVTGLLALTVCDLGRFDEAEEFAEKSRTLAAEDDFASQAVWRMAKARVLAQRGEFEEALTLADEAVAINGRTDYLVWQGDSHEVRGLVLETAGRRDEARAAYAEALIRYERKGNIVAADRIRNRIED
jgi:class 3 adenylate cyclase/tetratricopeptide (TPR) repeat protein